MKTILLLLFSGFLHPVTHDTGPDDILGIWMNQSGKGQIQIYKDGDKYAGKVIWLKEPNNNNGTPKLDIKNPRAALQTRPILGCVILHGFSYKNEEWSGGLIYDPASGKEYRCTMKLKNPKTLSVRGYIGISLLGRTEEWVRMK
ncbi:MAG TPA: DUF2147 domain-containing protein [Sediminibacterium sp.]